MSAGRGWTKEFYVGFLLFLLTFLYLSHLKTEWSRSPAANRQSTTFDFQQIDTSEEPNLEWAEETLPSRESDVRPIAYYI